jgi:nucleoside-diphosphate-sugar epimerase
MRVLLGGATGAIGIPIVTRLVEGGNDVTGITRTEWGAAALADLGADSVRADVLDRDGLLGAVAGRRYDAVIHELTALKKPPARFGDMTATNVLRTTGTENLLAAARAVGATRFVTQSIVFGYGYADHGDEPLTERSRFGQPSADRFAPSILAMAAAENQVFDSPDVEGVALRYGLFYGRDIATVATMMRGRRLPVTSYAGTLGFVHHDDAAAATVAALRRGRADSAYNIVDDTPISWRDYATKVASTVSAPPPLTLPGWLLRTVAPYAGRFMTRVSMVVSNARAKEELGWKPEYGSSAEGVGASAYDAGLATTRSGR